MTEHIHILTSGDNVWDWHYRYLYDIIPALTFNSKYEDDQKHLCDYLGFSVEVIWQGIVDPRIQIIFESEEDKLYFELKFC